MTPLQTDMAMPSEKQNNVAVRPLSLVGAYYEMTKPGITRMVVLSAAAGYYLGVEKASVYFATLENVVNFLMTMVGIAFVSAGSCVLNNFLEREYDGLMKRTMNRPIPSGAVSPKNALVFGLTLSALGVLTLSFFNALTVILAIITLLLYVVVYTPLKRKTTLSLLIGGLPGALPALGGWTATTDAIGYGGLFFAGLMFFWQMPHFLALSWMYKQDYERGGYAMLAVKDTNGKRLALQAIGYVLILMPFTLSLAIIQKTGMVYLLGSSALCLVFLYFAIQLLRNTSIVNARKLLLSSYLYLVGIFVLIFVDKV
jgi:protoheme IX farnesyltransferase